MKIRNILSVFGFDVWRSNGRWYACSGEGPAHSAGDLHNLIEAIVPPPPGLLTASAIRAWAEECVAASCREIDPETLAQAAFSAYGIDPPDEFVECFVSACAVDRRRLMERRG